MTHFLPPLHTTWDLVHSRSSMKGLHSDKVYGEKTTKGRPGSERKHSWFS